MAEQVRTGREQALEAERIAPPDVKQSLSKPYNPKNKADYGGKNATAAWQERVAKWREGGQLEQVQTDGPGELAKRGPKPKTLNPWQVGEDGNFVGPDKEFEEKFEEQLPEGALGWDPNGEAYYGGRTPFQEWQLRAHANLRNKENVTQEQASWDDWGAPKVADAYKEGGIVAGAKAVFSGLFETYKQASESVDYMLSGGGEEVTSAQQAWRQVSHYGGETLQRLGSLAYQTKLGFGGLAHLYEEATQVGSGVGDADVHFPERNAQLDADYDQFAVVPQNQDRFWRTLGVSANTIDEYKQGALAGRMFYTTIWDNAVDRVKGITGTGQAGNMKKEEFMRYMKSNPNANPNVWVKAYENPGAEMWGEIIFDPLNVVEWGMKTAVAGLMLSRASKYMADPMMAMGKALKAQGARRLTGLVDDAQDAAGFMAIVAARVTDVGDALTKQGALQKSKAIWQLDNAGKARVAAQDLVGVNQWAIRAAKRADDTIDVDLYMDIQNAIAKTAGDSEYLRLAREAPDQITDALRRKNENVIKEGINELTDFPGYDIAFTEPGTRSAIFMQDAYNPQRAAKIRSIIDNVDEMPEYGQRLKAVVEYSDEVIEKITKDMFPDIIEQGAKKAGGGYYALAKAHEYLYTKGPYKWFNKVFSSIYMGLNPGFAARNFMQNTLQGVLDEGVRGIIGWKSADNLLAWGGGVMPVGSVQRIGGTVVAGETNVKLTSKLFVGTRAAGYAEEIAGTKIFGKIYPKTMKKLLNKGLSFRELEKFGLNAKESKMVLSKLLESKGNVDEAMDWLVDAASKGYYEVSHSTMSWSDEMISFADEFQITDKLLDQARNGANMESVTESWSRVFKELYDAGDGVIDDIDPLAPGSFFDEASTARMYSGQTYGQADAQAELFALNWYGAANEKVWTSGQEAFTHYKTNMAKMLVQDGVFRTADEANDFMLRTLDDISVPGSRGKKVRDFFNGQAGKEYGHVKYEHDALVARAHNNVGEMMADPKKTEKFYKAWGLEKTNGAYTGQTKDTVMSLIWDEQLHQSRKYFETFRDQSVAAFKISGETIRDAVANATGKAQPDQIMDEVFTNLSRAQKWDKTLAFRKIRKPLFAAIDRKDMPGVARQFANMFGVSSADALGAADDGEILKVLNKQYKLKLQSLKELGSTLTPGEIEKAFIANQIGDTVRLITKGRSEGLDLMRKYVVQDFDKFTDAEIKIMEQTHEALLAVDRQVAYDVSGFIGDLNVARDVEYPRILAREGKDAADSFIGDYQARLDDLMDEAEKAMGLLEEEDAMKIAEDMVQKRVTDMRKSNKVDPDMTVYNGQNPPSDARQMFSSRGAIKDMEAKFVKNMQDNFGSVEKIDKSAVERLLKAKKHVASVVEESRQIAGRVALNKRNFILHDYGKKRNLDLMASYVMPYHFWYNRTYAAWAQRAVTHPGTITAYLDYKDAMGKMHADLPEWWKYNLNSNELLGIDSDNPFYFNLEQTLWPLNGLTGVDFTDKDKAKTWFSSTMQELGKYGPSIYTPISLMIAADMYRRGEKEAAAKWGGRLIPQTQMIKAATSMAGMGPGKSGIELDPMIWALANGVDIWESRRIGRALGWGVDNGSISEEAAQQAALEGPGNPIYDNARGIAQSKRSSGQLASFFLGTGFKARTQEDIEIDQMDMEYNRFRAMRDTMDPAEVTDAYAYFAKKYPFFNTLQVARKDQGERINSYTYSVLRRIPPGQTSQAYEAMGLTSEKVNEFYANKGMPDTWSERDKNNFTDAIKEMGVVLAAPEEATADEWREVKDANSKLYESAVEEFGEEAKVGADIYWGLYREDRQSAYDYKDKHPEVTAYMDYITLARVNDPLLAEYYGSYGAVNSLLNAEQYDRIEERFGPDLWKTQQEYQELKLKDAKAATAFKKAHPELAEYTAFKADTERATARTLLGYAKLLPDRPPMPEFREDIPESAQGTVQAIEQSFGDREVPEYFRWPWAQWASVLSPNMGELMLDYASGEDLSYTAEQALEYQLKDMGVDIDTAKELMVQSLRGSGPPPATQEQQAPQSSGGPVGRMKITKFEDGSRAVGYMAGENNFRKYEGKPGEELLVDLPGGGRSWIRFDKNGNWTKINRKVKD